LLTDREETEDLSLSSNSIHRPQSLREQIYETVRKAILAGKFTAGERLVETQLAKELQVSRTPIREALRQLQREYLLTEDTSGRLCVATLSVADAADLYDCRIALEQLSVAQACQKATSAQLKELHSLVQQAEQAFQGHRNASTSELDYSRLLQIDYQFHHLIAESSHNPWLIFLLDQLFDKMALLRIRTLQHNLGVLEIRSEHHRIYEAIASGEPQIAAQTIKDHLIASKARVVQEIQQLEKTLAAES
jgi:DNA-binding GntR family transcriptional regulator